MVSVSIICSFVVLVLLIYILVLLNRVRELKHINTLLDKEISNIDKYLKEYRETERKLISELNTLHKIIAEIKTITKVEKKTKKGN